MINLERWVFNMQGINVLGFGYYLPKKKVINDDFIDHVDTSDEWIKTRTGINSRYLSEDENTSKLAYEASIKAIKNAKIDKEKIDLIIVATMTPDNFTPSTACILQGLLGLNDTKVMAFDINAACSGYVYSLNVANAMLNSGLYKCALVVGCETLSKIIDFTDRSTCILFGDGAGALVIEGSDTKKSYFYARSKYDEDRFLIAEGIQLSSNMNNSIVADHYLKMNGQEVFKFAINALEDGINEILKMSNKTIDDIDIIVPHQANFRIINNVSRKLKLSANKMYVNLDKYGNTSAASIAIALSEGFESGVIKRGMKVILVGFGAGLTWGAVYLEL